MKIKRLIIFISVLIFLGTISVISYNYAIWKTKRDILKEFKKFFNSKVDYKNLKFSLSNFSFEELSIRWFSIKNFSLNYNIFAFFTFKNLGDLKIDEVNVHLDSLISFLRKKTKEEKKTYKRGNLFFILNKGNIKRVKVLFREKEYIFENVDFSINTFGREYKVYTSLSSPSFYNFKGRINFLGNKKSFKIFTQDFKSELFDLKFNIDIEGKDFKFYVFNSSFKDFKVYAMKGEGKREKDYVKVKELNINSNYFNLKSNFVLKNNNISGYATGNFRYEVLRGNLQSNFAIDIKERFFSGKLWLNNVSYKDLNFEEIFYKGFIYSEKFVLPDSIYVSSEFLKGYGKKKGDALFFKIEKLNSKFFEEFLPYELKPDFNIKSTGIFKIKEKDFEVLMQGMIENFVFKDLKSKLIIFNLNRENKINEVSFYSNLLELKNTDISLGLLQFKFIHPESANFKISGFFPFIGNLNEEGYFIRKNKKIHVFLKKGEIILNPYPEKVNLDSLNFLNGYLFIKGEDNKYKLTLLKGDLSYIPFFDLAGKINFKGDLNLSDSFKIKSINGELKIDSFYYSFFNLDSITLSLMNINDLIKGEGSFFKDKKRGILNLTYSPSRFYFEVYGNDFDIKEMNYLFREYFKFEEGDFDFNLEGEIERERKIRYKAEINCEKVNGVFYPVQIVFNNLHTYVEFNNDTFLYDFTGLSEKGRLKGSGIGVMGLLDGDFSIEGKLRLSNVNIYPISNIEANVSGEINYKSDHTGLYIDGDLFVERCFIYPYFEEKKEERFSKTKINLNFKGENIFIAGEYINAELKGNLSILSPDFTKRVYSGGLEIKRGNIFYLGRVFEIKENSYILLKGAESFDPELYINAETDYKDPKEGKKVKILVEVRGNFLSPQFVLKSEPSIYTESEIIRRLTLGSEIPGSIIIEGTISQEIRRRLKLEEFLITGLLKGDPTFIVGTYVSESVYVRYLQGITDPSKNLYLIKYFILPSLSVYGEKDEKGSLQSGLELEIRF